MRSIIIISTIILFTISCSLARNTKIGKCPKPEDSDKLDFDVNKYLGRWYEIKRSDNPYEKGVKCSTANYSLKNDGKINVTNVGINPKGDNVVAHLTASIINPDQPNFLNVEIFPGAPTSSYWVIDTDFNTYSAVFSCIQITDDMHSVSGWILSRSETLDSQMVDKLVELLKSKGVTDLMQTDRTDCFKTE